MQGKLDTANAKGLKKSEINALRKLLSERIPQDEIVSFDLAENIASISYGIEAPISAVVNRRGQVVNITVGTPSQVQMPELKGIRVGPGRLSGYRIVYTKIVDSDAAQNKSKQNGKTDSFSKDELQCLARNRLDLLALVEVNPNVPFSRARGEHPRFADSVQTANLLPQRDSQGKLWKLSERRTIRQVQDDNFSVLIGDLEDSFRRLAPGLAVKEGEERAILVGLVLQGSDPWQVEDDLDELAQLAKTAGATVCSRFMQTRSQVNPKFFLGSGKAQELALEVQELGATLVIVDQELSAHQQRNLEEIVGVKVIDRSELILDIFAQRANTREGKLQVELAQLQYLYPRLIGKGLSLSRLGGGIGTRGPGETKLEIDRRRIRERITLLERETERISTYRDTQRRGRVSENLPNVAIVGYTNAGKSTLLNALTKADVIVENKLFATLDPATRRTTLPDHSPVLMTDTVGFIKKLPTSLVAAFKATLEEATLSDMLIHVVDASHPNVTDQIASVYDVLSELGAIEKPLITVLNKCDLVRKEDLDWLASQVPNPVFVSAKARTGLGGLLTAVQSTLEEIYPHRKNFSA